MIEITCEHCHKPFLGRPNRKCCSVRCRRTLETRRRFWDRHFSYVRYCEMNAEWQWHTAKEKETWRKRADEIREKLLKVYGNRP
jgi:hypothetical protein